MSVQVIKPIIDIAVLKREYINVSLNETITIHTDNYPKSSAPAIKATDFKNLFFQNGNFNPVPKSQLFQGPNYDEFVNIISLNEPKEIAGNEVDLPEIVIKHIETNLNTSRDMFTPCSTINLATSLLNLKYFSDITQTSNSINCSLTWEQILKSINYLAQPSATTYEAVLRITLFLEAIASTSILPLRITYNFNVEFDIPAV